MKNYYTTAEDICFWEPTFSNNYIIQYKFTLIGVMKSINHDLIRVNSSILYTAGQKYYYSCNQIWHSKAVVFADYVSLKSGQLSGTISLSPRLSYIHYFDNMSYYNKWPIIRVVKLFPAILSTEIVNIEIHL